VTGGDRARIILTPAAVAARHLCFLSLNTTFSASPTARRRLSSCVTTDIIFIACGQYLRVGLCAVLFTGARMTTLWLGIHIPSPSVKQRCSANARVVADIMCCNILPSTSILDRATTSTHAHTHTAHTHTPHMGEGRPRPSTSQQKHGGHTEGLVRQALCEKAVGRAPAFGSLPRALLLRLFLFFAFEAIPAPGTLKRAGSLLSYCAPLAISYLPTSLSFTAFISLSLSLLLDLCDVPAFI